LCRAKALFKIPGIIRAQMWKKDPLRM